MANKKKNDEAGKLFPAAKSREMRTNVLRKSAAGTATVQRAPAARKPFPIVGPRADAGGRQALERFHSHLPADWDIALVVVTHPHPGHTGLRSELLDQCTRMRVKVVGNGAVLAANTVYFPRPDGQLAVMQEAITSRLSGCKTKTTSSKL
jgi:two-component system CheB/CheR fusion protein